MSRAIQARKQSLFPKDLTLALAAKLPPTWSLSQDDEILDDDDDYKTPAKIQPSAPPAARPPAARPSAAAQKIVVSIEEKKSASASSEDEMKSPWQDALVRKISELLIAELKQQQQRRRRQPDSSSREAPSETPPPSGPISPSSSPSSPERLVRIEPGDMTVFRLRTGHDEDAYLKLHNYGSSAALGVSFLPSASPAQRPTTPPWVVVEPIMISQLGFLLHQPPMS